MNHVGPGLISTLAPAPRGVLFDYGNTLIPFGQREMDAVSGALVGFLAASLPGAAPGEVAGALGAAMTELHRQRMKTNRESDPRDLIRLTFRAFGAVADEADHVEPGVGVILDAFVSSVERAPDSPLVLAALRERGYRLGLLSNYSLAAAIRDSLDRLELTGYFDVVVVSADLGLLKPDPELFLETARRLALDPGDILYVGDNLRADVAGAAAVGMRTAHITEHLAGAYFFEHPDENLADVRPDLTLGRLRDLTHGDS